MTSKAESRQETIEKLAERDADRMREAHAKRLREAVSSLLGVDIDLIIVDGEPTPMVARKEEGCFVVSDAGEVDQVDAEGWCESESASIIAVVHDPHRTGEALLPEHTQGPYPYREYPAVASITVRPDCPPYRVIKTLLDNGVDL